MNRSMAPAPKVDQMQASLLQAKDPEGPSATQNDEEAAREEAARDEAAGDYFFPVLAAGSNIVCQMAGMGILQLPYMLRQGGWLCLVLIGKRRHP